nr:ATP-binding protein [Lachnospiraceae bacterium]
TDNLDSISPSNSCYLIMGVRGIGKTVLLSTISNEYRDKDDWVVVSLNPGRDLLRMLAAALYEDGRLQRHFLDASLNLSKFGIGFDIKKKPPISDIQIAIEKMVRIVNDEGKRLLITIDDVTKNKDVVSFACVFRDMITQRMEAFLLMTGLYENIYSLQTDKRCSFLMRAEKIILKPLNIIGIKSQYRQTFQCDEETALKMAAFTKGYSYAFQVLGYIMWDKDCSLEEAAPFFDERMSGYCYEKIWEDLPEREKEIVSLLALNTEMKTKDLIRSIGCDPKAFSVQRDRLIKKGIVDGRQRGSLRLILPRFGEFLKTTGYSFQQISVDKLCEPETITNDLILTDDDSIIIEILHDLPHEQKKRLIRYLELLQKESE